MQEEGSLETEQTIPRHSPKLPSKYNPVILKNLYRLALPQVALNKSLQASGKELQKIHRQTPKVKKNDRTIRWIKKNKLIQMTKKVNQNKSAKNLTTMLRTFN